MSNSKVRDNISELPDELLRIILSCLDTPCAVRTTILSPRWKNFWTSVPSLRFCSEDFSDFDAFMAFVDHVLFRDSSDIKKFYLDCKRPKENDFSRIENWICTVLSRNVVELSLRVNIRSRERFELPQSLFTCKTLEVLRLNSNFIAKTPKSGCFPSLKVLEVRVDYPDRYNSSLEQMFCNCPVLEDLKIEGDLAFYKDILDINISAPELKRLILGLEIGDFVDEEYNFYIDAPKLEVFDFLGGDSTVFSFEITAKSIFKANIHPSSCLGSFSGTNVLLEAISNVKQLSLSTKFLERAVPAFDNLNRLELTLCGCTCWGYLIEFLDRSPNLEYLVIRHKLGGEPEHFSPPVVVPLCMLSHLKTITISSFKGSHYERKVSQYLLKYSKVLNKMTIFTIPADFPRGQKKALYNELLMFEQGSETCQVEICD